ncbi:unnamed protein product [Plutella xylostella]|uniref:small monomeric GTPase n=1 Tax=Plutella xylostella TaxID=51655 RepID=A0A8S4DGJ1_PLUXY|nr:ras-related and estrogen-regulated growth inhibitor-like protein [Plutella xylostella]CAG9098168.1 unnamed protein product [Plutella xylostella]
MRDERASLPRVRIAVIGSSRVGKSALIVRYLTRRYIGEYHSNTDLLYRQTVPINGTPVELEVIDVSGTNADKFPAEQIQWADACLLVYSVTDRSSFDYATEVMSSLRRGPGAAGGSPAHAAAAPMPLALLGNKTDLDHLRQVSTKEGQSLCSSHGASFSEASVADNSNDLYRCVDKLLSEVRTPSQRTRKFSVTKMLGSLIGGTNNSSSTSRSGSVVACPRMPPPARPPLAAAAP